MIYDNANPVNITNISKTALKDFYQIRSLLHTGHHNEIMDIKNRNRADKRDINYTIALAICEKWINANDPIDLD